MIENAQKHDKAKRSGNKNKDILQVEYQIIGSVIISPKNQASDQYK
jgi:hypothetical protein